MAATASPNLNDQAILAVDPGFISRVQQSLAAACTAIINEADSTAFHYARMRLAVQVMTTLANAAPSYGQRFAIAVATDTNVISDATVAGGTPLSQANVAAQGLLVTDAHINAAVSGQYNSFINKTQ